MGRVCGRWALYNGLARLQATSDYTAEEMTTLIDGLGSNILCSSSRETIMYQSTVFPHHLPTAMRLISSTIHSSRIDADELEAQKEAAAYEIREIWAKPDLILPELVHHVAFRDNTLGMPLLCPEEQLARIDTETLRGYMRDWYRPERMVVAGVGMEHEQLVRLAEEHFGALSADRPLYAHEAATGPARLAGGGKGWVSASSSPAAPQSKSYATTAPYSAEPSVQELAAAQARYTGGEMFIEKPDEEFTHVYIAFEGLGIHDPDIVSRHDQRSG